MGKAGQEPLMSEEAADRLKATAQAPGWRRRAAPLWHGLVLVIVALLAWEFIDFPRLGRALLGADHSMVMLLVLLLVLDRVAMAWKWRLLLRAIGVEVRLRTLVLVYFQAAFLGRALPTSLGGDVYRAYAVSQTVSAWDRIVSSMMIEKGVAILAAGIMAAASVLALSKRLIEQGALFLLILVPFVTVLSGVVLFASLSPSFGRHLERLLPWEPVQRTLVKLHTAYCLYSSQKQTLFVNLWLSIGEQSLQIMCLYVSALAVGVTVDDWRLPVVLALSQFLRKFAILLEGWALGEFISVLTLALVGIDQTQALAVSFLPQAAGLILAAPMVLALLSSPKQLLSRRRNLAIRSRNSST
jgi:uncharacterized protein (TIRG00374 family)